MSKRAIIAAGVACALALLTTLLSCGGTASLSAPARQGALAPVQIIATTGAKVASGPPIGIFVTWTRSTDPRATGYYLYRDTESIPDPPPDGNLPPELRTNGGLVIPQPPDGDTVNFNDIFPVTIGQEYFYRVTVLNDDDPPAESYPSNEMSWVVHGHTVGNVTPDSAYWGDEVAIAGNTFGAYDDTTDFVRFTAIGGGTVEGAVTGWTDTTITATVPEGADSGPVFVIIDGTPAQTDNELTILNPVLYSLDPAQGFLEQPLAINGKNFGEQQLASEVYLGGVDVSDLVTDWSATQIVLTVPVDPGAGAVYVIVQTHISNSLEFTPRPEIFSAVPAVQSGETVTLGGRLFGATEGTVLLDGATPLGVVSWAADTIEATLIGAVGAHTLTVVDAGGVASNDFSYEIIPDLTVTLTGLEDGALYTAEAPPAIGVTTAADAERVELVIDGAVFQFSLTPPFGGMTLPVARLTNGAHTVSLKAYRRSIVAESATLSIVAYSLVGDVNGDGLVDAGDRDELAGLIGLDSEDPGFEPWYDTDGDGQVTEADLSAVGYHFGDEIEAP